MKFLSTFLSAFLLVIAPAAVLAEDGRFAFGGDQFTGGQAARLEAPVERDAFLAGFDVTQGATVAGDAHLAGFNVTSSAAITGNLYAAGSNLGLDAPIGGDVTAMANTIALRSGATVGGNVRLAGASVTLTAPIAGSALVTAETLTLEGTIAGDLSFFGRALVFGPNAVVTGRLIIQAPAEIAVPATVASADRVTYSQLVAPDYASEAGKTAEHVVRSVWPAVWATGLWWLLLAVVGIAVIALAPRLVAALEAVSERRPFRNLGVGVLGFASTLGLVPVFAITIVGLFLLPFVLVYVFIACALAYLTGTYLVGRRIASAIIRLDSNLKRVGVLVGSILVAGLLGMVPVLGWIITLLLLAFGFGVVGVRTMARWSRGETAAITHAPSQGPATSQPA